MKTTEGKKIAKLCTFSGKSYLLAVILLYVAYPTSNPMTPAFLGPTWGRGEGENGGLQMVTVSHNGRREKSSNKYVINFQRSVGNPSVLSFDFVEQSKKKKKEEDFM